MDQMFAIKMLVVEEYLGIDTKLYAAFTIYDRVDREALWNVLKIYGKGGQLMEGIIAFYGEANACVKADGEFSDSFATELGAREGCVMSPWLFNIFMDGCMKKMKSKVGKIGARLKLNGVSWPVAAPACLFAHDTMLPAEDERDLQREVDRLNSV